jgi:hypothetical protein
VRKKTYNQFIEEAVSLQEVVPLLPFAGMGALKLGSAALAAWSAYDAAQKIKKGDYKGAAIDAAGAIPVGGTAFKLAKAFGAGKNLARSASALASTAKFAGVAKAKSASGEEPTQSNGQDTAPKPQSTGSSGSTPQSSSVVLARKGGVEGSLDKSTGKFTASNWSSAESDRYAKYGGKPTPTPTPTPTPSSDSRTKNILDRMKAKRNSGTPTLTPTPTPSSDSRTKNILDRMKAKRNSGTPTRLPNLPNIK